MKSIAAAVCGAVFAGLAAGQATAPNFRLDVSETSGTPPGVNILANSTSRASLGFGTEPRGNRRVDSRAVAQQTVNPGANATYTISTAGLNGFSGSITLTASGLPAGATASFSPNPVSAGGSSTLTISTTGPAAQTTFTVTGTSGSLSNSTAANITSQGSTLTLSKEYIRLGDRVIAIENP